MAETTPSNGTVSQHGATRPVTLSSTNTLDTPDGQVKFNVGKSIPDTEDIVDGVPLSQWQKDASIDPTSQVKIVKLSHMRYQHAVSELPTITKFLQDFGMHIAKRSDDGTKIWFKGYGPDQYVYYAQAGESKAFLGGSFEVESYSDLEKALKIPGCDGKIEEMSDAPGGGHILTLHDPEGFAVNLIYGQAAAPKSQLPEKVIYNDETDKPRVRKFNRYTPGPAAVHKLGHYGLCVTDFPSQVKWYTTYFNFAPTDFLYAEVGDGKKLDVALFAHIDRGDDPVDHHTFFMSTNKKRHVHHCSFEVHDYDTQHLGHQHLAAQKYTSVWGIGRHILGSQYVSGL